MKRIFVGRIDDQSLVVGVNSAVKFAHILVRGAQEVPRFGIIRIANCRLLVALHLQQVISLFVVIAPQSERCVGVIGV